MPSTMPATALRSAGTAKRSLTVETASGTVEQPFALRDGQVGEERAQVRRPHAVGRVHPRYTRGRDLRQRGDDLLVRVTRGVPFHGSEATAMASITAAHVIPHRAPAPR